jgi:hypothetical protein
VLTFFAGAVLGALTAVFPLWLASGLMQPVPPSLRVGMLVLIASFTVLRDWEIIRFRLPENRRQVPQIVFAKGRSRAALQFGFEMGTGVRTYVTATSPFSWRPLFFSRQAALLVLLPLEWASASPVALSRL